MQAAFCAPLGGVCQLASSRRVLRRTAPSAARRVSARPSPRYVSPVVAALAVPASTSSVYDVVIKVGQSVSDVIHTAASGSRILLAPGVHEVKETIHLDDTVYLFGEGKATLHGLNRNLVIARAQLCTISGVAFRLSSSRPFPDLSELDWKESADARVHWIGGNGFYAVSVRRGSLLLEDCDLASETVAAIEIRDGGSPSIKRALIHDCTWSGIVIHVRGRGRVEASEICRCRDAGVDIRDGSSDPLILGNDIHHCGDEGISCHSGGRGKLDGNNLHDNGHGIVIFNEGDPVVLNNKIHSNLHHGVYSCFHGLGRLESNDIFSNGSANIAVASHGNPLVLKNTIRDGATHGVYVTDSGEGSFEQNELRGNASGGFFVSEYAAPVIASNRIYSHAGVGIWVGDNGRGTIDSNDIYQCGCGIELWTGCSPKIEKNSIHDNRGEGIALCVDGDADIETSNKVYSNGYNGAPHPREESRMYEFAVHTHQT